jgi:hypothetical protein
MLSVPISLEQVMSEQQDDLDLEVSALESPAAQNAGDASAPSDSSSARPSKRPARQVSLAAQRTRAQRLLRMGCIIIVLTAFILIALLLPSGNRDALVNRLIPPIPSPTALPQPGDDAFLWEHSVPWGQLLIDGRPGPIVSGAALAQEGQRPPEDVTFHLRRGQHTLEYHADGFPTLRCTVSVPYSRDDTCPLERGPDMRFGDTSEPLLRILDLRATMDRLSPTLAQSLVQATQEQLEKVAGALPPGMLGVGDHYLDAQGQVRQVTAADAPLTMMPHFHLTTSITNNEGTPCVTLCDATGFGDPYTAKGWSLLALVGLSWRYAHADGQVALDDGPSALLPSVRGVLVHVLAGSPEAGRWQIDVQQWSGASDARQTDPMLCPTADLYRRFVEVTSNPGVIGKGNVQWPYEASTAELGCLLAGSQTDPNTGKPIGPIALLLYRAGVLLAGNDQAQRWFPMLPLASAHERALAQAVAPTRLA